MGTNLRVFKKKFHAGLFRPIVGYRRRALYNFFEILILDTARKQRIFLDTTDRGHLNLFFSFDRENCCGILEYLRYCTIRYNSFEVLECAFRIAEQISLHNCIRHI